ncbi:MAG: hypothetical protein HC905_31445 [Bacteroidales bacterium]|nr:hypothetical protein [Bacteroidales bacterium]
MFYLFIIFINLKYTDNPRTAWIFKSLPVNHPGEIVTASLKAFTLKLFLPVYLICTGFIIYALGWLYVFHIATGLFMCLITLLGFLSLYKVDLPFTQDSQIKTTNANFLLSFLILPLAGVLAGIHFLLIKLQVSFIPI